MRFLPRSHTEAIQPDHDVLVEAFAQVAIAGGKVTAEQVANDYKAKWRQRADDDAEWVKNAYNADGVKAAYARIIGKPVKTVEDLI